MKISQAAEELIIDEEVGSRAAYTKKYQRPEWPGEASGITVMIGFDCGYSTAAEIQEVLLGGIDSGMIGALATCAGKKGDDARAMLSWIRPQVQIPLDVAMNVFEKTDVPKWENIVAKVLPNTDLLSSDSFGALVSLAYNRGTGGFDSSADRFREMHMIKILMATKKFEDIPNQIRLMKRLWNNGLVGRREREALLFERGLAVAKGKAPQPIPTRTQIVVKKAAKAGTAAGAGGGGGAVVLSPASHVHWIAPLVIIVFVALAVCVSLYVTRHRLLPKADPTGA